MSDTTIFRFSTPPSPSNGLSASAFHHAAIDADASARLAAIDRSLADDENASNTCSSHDSAESQSEAEHAFVDDLIIESDDAAVSAPAPCSNENEVDMSDPLAVLSQTLATTELNASPIDAPEIEIPQIELAQVDFAQVDAAQIEPAEVEPAQLELPQAELPQVELAEVEVVQIELAQVELPASLVAESPAPEVTGIFSATEAAGEILVHHAPASEPVAEELNIIETTVAETDFNAEAEAAAPAPLEVAPILDASGELQPGANDYTPPAPFEIHVDGALPAETISSSEAADSDASFDALSESFDLDSLSAPTEAEQIIEKAIAQEDAVAEMSAAAEEFVAEQIASDSQDDADAKSETAAPIASLASAAEALKSEPSSDRRRKRRALISSPIRVRSINVTTSGPDEIATTVDVSRYGILFYTVLDTYQRGMDVAVVFPYHKSATGVQAEQFGRVVRLHDMPDGRHAVAIALGVGIGEHLVDSNGRKLGNEPVQLSNSTAPAVKKPLVLMADSDPMLRDTMKIFLQNEGYEVIAVNNANDAREVLNMFMPAMIVAEIEGEADLLPGLDLCAHVKSSPTLRRIPVVLTSRSAYPSDYSNAHSLGAVVCMAKPYKQERLGHIVRLLAPLPEHLQSTSAPRIPDPTRGFRSDCHVTQRRNGTAKKPANGASKTRFKFPSFR